MTGRDWDRLARIAVNGLATFRLARIIPSDDIAAPIRVRLDRWALEHATSDGPGWRGYTAQLLTCPVCSGWWIAGILAVASSPRDRSTRNPRVIQPRLLSCLVTDWAATAGVAALLSRIDASLDRV